MPPGFLPVSKAFLWFPHVSGQSQTWCSIPPVSSPPGPGIPPDAHRLILPFYVDVCSTRNCATIVLHLTQKQKQTVNNTFILDLSLPLASSFSPSLVLQIFKKMSLVSHISIISFPYWK